MAKIALYDMDRTITKRPTYTSFLLHAAWRHEKWRLLLLPASLLAVIAFYCRMVDRAKLKELNQSLLLGPVLPAETAERIAQSYAQKLLSEGVFVQALGQIAIDKAERRRLVLATASYEFYARAIGEALGFDDIVATLNKRDGDGAILPVIEGQNCYAEAKRRMVEAWMADLGIARDAAEIRFYSDSSSDLPVFEMSDEPIATNPTSKLRRIAEKRGWPIKSWG